MRNLSKKNIKLKIQFIWKEKKLEIKQKIHTSLIGCLTVPGNITTKKWAMRMRERICG